MTLKGENFPRLARSYSKPDLLCTDTDVKDNIWQGVSHPLSLDTNVIINLWIL